MSKKKYHVEGIANDLLPKIDEWLWAYTALQAWHIVKIRIRERFGWHYNLSQEKIIITEIKPKTPRSKE